MTDILSTNDSLFTKDDMIMTDNGYYANMSIQHTSKADTGGGNKSYSGKKVSDNYKNLGFPALYLYTINDTCYKQPDNEIMPYEPTDNEIMPDTEIMSDDLYNKLISLAELKPVVNKKYTRNKKNIKKTKGKKTRRTKKI
jgi:hypothetical protein